MKAALASLTRHALTWIAGLTAVIMALPFMLPEDQAEVAQHVDAIAVGAVGLVTVILTRALPWLVAKFAPGLGKIFQGDSGTKGGGAAASLLMMATAAGAALVGGSMLLSSCVVGVDENGDWTLRPDPYSIDAALKYAIRHEDSKGYIWVDAETGEPIAPEDLHQYELEAR